MRMHMLRLCFFEAEKEDAKTSAAEAATAGSAFAYGLGWAAVTGPCSSSRRSSRADFGWPPDGTPPPG